MKAIHVIDSLMIGGAERVLIDQVNLLSARGWDISVLVLGGKYPLRTEMIEGVSFFVVDRKAKFSWNGIRTIVKLCQRNDIVHVHLRYNFRYIALIKLLFFGRFQIIHHDHYGDIDDFRHVPFLLGFLSKLNPWFIGVSRNLTNWAIKELNLPPNKVLLLPNIVRIQPSLKRNLKKGNSKHSLRLLVVANFREAKNHSFVYGLVPDLLKKYESVEVHFYGQILIQSFYESLKAQAREHGIDEFIFFHTDCRNVQPLLNSFDLAIHPALRESGPLVLIEYLGHELPFVAFKTGQVADQLKSRLPEFFIDSFEQAAWLERINFLVERHDTFGKRMQECFMEYFSEHNYITNLENFYLDVMKA